MTWCFHNCEPDIHKPPNTPISKYAWRTKLFCLTYFLVVTLSAALHSSRLVSAGSAGVQNLSQLVCAVCPMSGNHNLFFFPILVRLCRDARARKAYEHDLLSDCEQMIFMEGKKKKINKSCQSLVFLIIKVYIHQWNPTSSCLYQTQDKRWIPFVLFFFLHRRFFLETLPFK